MNKSVRENYAELGVDTYYKITADSYVNPHKDIVQELLQKENIKGKVLDMCCGSGEVTLSLNSNVCEVTGLDKYSY